MKGEDFQVDHWVVMVLPVRRGVVVVVATPPSRVLGPWEVQSNCTVQAFDHLETLLGEIVLIQQGDMAPEVSPIRVGI